MTFMNHPTDSFVKEAPLPTTVCPPSQLLPEYVSAQFPCVVQPEEHAIRLDALIKQRCQPLGIRGVRRLWQWCHITVNRKPGKPGTLLRENDTICITPQGPPASSCPNLFSCSATTAQPTQADFSEMPHFSEMPPGQLPYLLYAQGNWAAVYKPCGLHSAHISGSHHQSLEKLLGTFWVEWVQQYCDTQHMPPEAACALCALPPPHLLSRLDGATSGIVLAAQPDEIAIFRQWERCGTVQKTYYTLVHGVLNHPLYLDAHLNTANRKKTQVNTTQDPDATRHTRVGPIRTLTAEEIYAIFTVHLPHLALENATIDLFDLPMTLVQVIIQRGARHQIRAHLGQAGFPLVGEWLYIDPDALEREIHFIAALSKQETPTHSECKNSILPIAPEEQPHKPAGTLSKIPAHTQPDTPAGLLPLFLHHATLTTPLFTVQNLPTWLPPTL